MQKINHEADELSSIGLCNKEGRLQRFEYLVSATLLQVALCSGNVSLQIILLLASQVVGLFQWLNNTITGSLHLTREGKPNKQRKKKGGGGGIEKLNSFVIKKTKN